MSAATRRGRPATAATWARHASVVVAALVCVFCFCGAVERVEAHLERQTYVGYRTPHLCSYQIMEAVACPEAKPMCCVASSSVRCCASTTSCGNCTDDVVGYEMPKSSVIIGCFSLSVLVLLGSVIMSGVGRHLAWVLERRRVIENSRKRLLLRRAEAREFKRELAETEDKDIDDAVACVICCARHIDVALTPCGHVCCCRFCAKRLRECPVCRAAVQRCFDLPLYYVKQLLGAADVVVEEEESSGGGGHRHEPTTTTAAASTTTTSTSVVEMITITPDTAAATITREEREEDRRGAGEEVDVADISSRACLADGHASAAPARPHTPGTTGGAASVVAAAAAAEDDEPSRGLLHSFRRRYTRLNSSDDDDGSQAAAAAAAEEGDDVVGGNRHRRAGAGLHTQRTRAAAGDAVDGMDGPIAGAAAVAAASAALPPHASGYISVDR
ncbi:Zinc finger, C3HC4 type (RING finger) containing protein [Novymonas esmeraldas]|uniref:Zinc finger, C3HC4 type (RING finger) containing protein n=1 Tax=Novymonas esmeraldas TaxID=1808958 RepID=A0AAW0EW64_9TRYP